MKLQKSCKIELAASCDATRRVIAEPYLETETIAPSVTGGEAERKGQLIATDGRMMAIVPVELDEHDTTGWVNVEALKAARKACGKLDTKLGLNGAAVLTNGVTMPRTALNEPKGDYKPQYPNWRQVIPEDGKHTFKVSLNAELLWKLAQALGSEGGVELKFNPVGVGEEGKRHPDVILVAPVNGVPGARGLLMPMRLS